MIAELDVRSPLRRAGEELDARRRAVVHPEAERERARRRRLPRVEDDVERARARAGPRRRRAAPSERSRYGLITSGSAGVAGEVVLVARVRRRAGRRRRPGDDRRRSSRPRGSGRTGRPAPGPVCARHAAGGPGSGSVDERRLAAPSSRVCRRRSLSVPCGSVPSLGAERPEPERDPADVRPAVRTTKPVTSDSLARDAVAVTSSRPGTVTEAGAVTCRRWCRPAGRRPRPRRPRRRPRRSGRPRGSRSCPV